MFSSILHILAVAGAVQAYTVVNVDYFMYKNIDPIVIPGQYKSHLHTFFGSDAVNASTTTSTELRQGCSTAQNPNDFSIYCKPLPFTFCKKQNLMSSRDTNHLNELN